MDSEAAFKALLSTANFTADAGKAIVEFCAENLEDLALLPKKTLDTSILNLHKSLADLPRNKVRLNATKCTLLHSIRTHFNDRINCQALLNNTQIRAINLANIRIMKKDYLESEETLTIITGLSVVSVSKLDPLKWSAFKTSMVENFGRVIGKNNIPLTYVVRPLDVGDFEGTYETRLDRLNLCTILSGHKFKSDNGTVFSLLIQHTEGTEGYGLVQQYESQRNGRKAWTSLLNHYEGSTFRERVAQEAINMLRTASYSGPRRNFSFSSYYARHSTAHLLLIQAKKPMSVEQQIDTFVQGIQCATAQSIVVNLAGDHLIRSSFEIYYNAVASKLELSLSLTNPPTNRETRNVGEISRNKKTAYKGKKERGKFEKKTGSTGKPFAPECKNYSPSEWKALSFANKGKVIALHKAKRGHSESASQHSTNVGNQYAMVPYQPPRNVNQFGTQMHSQSNTQMVPYYYPNMRNVNSVQLPPYPNSNGVVPPPPPQPMNPNADQSTATGSINSNAGDVGQYFGGNNGYF